MTMSALEHVKSSLLGETMRLRISDSRLVQGELQCFDKDMNFVLSNATEYHGMDNDTDDACQAKFARYLGMIVVPGSHITKCLKMTSVALTI